MRGKWLGAVAFGLLGTAITMTAVVARKADQASRPASLCTLQFNGVTLENVPQVTTRVQMERGLSGLQEVGTGMLFTWSDDALRVFWMRGTPTPLSVAFIDAAGTVLQIEDMEPETEIMHWSTLPAREGLEMEIGDFQRLGITPGSRLIRRECKPVAEYQKRGM
ncbi:hypothetical protein PS874_06303 [Pseudomonas fluorescens]|nr:hypothetical protein PS874_06303 [Pseudomonas fluorescens]